MLSRTQPLRSFVHLKYLIRLSDALIERQSVSLISKDKN